MCKVHRSKRTNCKLFLLDLKNDDIARKQIGKCIPPMQQELAKCKGFFIVLKKYLKLPRILV
uniref:Uncharacterized protein n=1 Tax=Oryza brachyantha TaxID=4533 RepID=J3L6A3_ORYBR